MRDLDRGHPTTSSAKAPTHATTLAIVGRGRVGGSIASAAARAGIEVVTAGRDDASDAAARADVVLLCVPDAEIANAAGVIGRPQLVGHTSGATGLGVLESTGAAAFSLHPLQTIPDRSGEFTACPCAIAGSDAEALAFARWLAGRLGMIPFEVDDADRAAYHAAAAIASNFLVALEESAAGLLEQITPDARELLAPLVLRTAANWAERGGAALTGPIARGDEATVNLHLAALRERAPELVDLYEVLATRTRALAQGRA